MKKYVIIGAVLFTGMIFAQEPKPQLEAVGNKVKVTYFHENGKVQQEGYYKNGKLEGKWVSYDAEGNKLAIAEYKKGEKVGKWFFWKESTLSEVDYSNNQIASIKNWKKETIVNVD
jgi:antitoxin component YwqK of YwqJK toxin-antitoxin module